jgi:hypothetical protein
LKGFIEKGKSQEFEQIATEAVNQTNAVLAAKAKPRTKKAKRKQADTGDITEVRLEHARSLTRRLAAVR